VSARLADSHLQPTAAIRDGVVTGDDPVLLDALARSANGAADMLS
jgi:hypothetical protein